MLILIRGISGSGKTTLAEELLSDIGEGCHFENDDWHYVEGQYKFDKDQHKKAIQFCQLNTENAIRNKLFPVIVANTFTTPMEMQFYIDVADKYGINIEIMEPDTEWFNDENICINKNIHNVPENALFGQKNRYVEIENRIYKPYELNNILRDK